MCRCIWGWVCRLIRSLSHTHDTHTHIHARARTYTRAHTHKVLLILDGCDDVRRELIPLLSFVFSHTQNIHVVLTTERPLLEGQSQSHPVAQSPTVVGFGACVCVCARALVCVNPSSTSVRPSVRLSVRLPVRPSVCPFVRLSVSRVAGVSACMSIHHTIA